MASYPCPFRKRNPARFNIRDHETCARAPFDSIRGLKHHIVTSHGKEPSLTRHRCRRCKQQFETETALEEHLLLPRDQICEVTEASPVDYENGITEEVVRNLLYGKADSDPTSTWDGVWTLLFPDDLEVPDSDFNPVTELVEVEQAFDEGQDMLKESLREKLQLLLPEALDADYLSFLTGQLELVFETHKVNMMKQSLGRCSSTVSGAQPSRTQKAEDPSPPRKPNRRSRRSTILQNMHRNSTQDPTAAAPSRRVSNMSSTNGNNKRASRPFSEQSFLCRADLQRPTTMSVEAHTTATTAPPPLEHHHPLSPHPSTPSHNNSTGTNSPTNPRDSRDSGISMSCDACALEPCACADHHQIEHESGTDTESEIVVGLAANDHDDGKWEHHPRRASPGHTAFPRRSRLSIQTADLHLRRRSGGVGGWEGGDDGDEDEEGVRREAEGEGGGGGGGDGGGFSPESFKQRLLRGRLMGV
ncbi:hypothetical protein F5144DRAFT_599024 [Chaetomium tenue]|uniref:Uncharacterized protein n=1 Tax=Chaetomium tenue TaxID=1854479 RepID=A0ACB7PEG0_9PEZI|nr:hypothetical protein F5144DRAFT_599024 [Chaetomium globosum]